MELVIGGSETGKKRNQQLIVWGYFSIYIYTESDRATEEKLIGHLSNEDAHVQTPLHSPLPSRSFTPSFNSFIDCRLPIEKCRNRSITSLRLAS